MSLRENLAENLRRLCASRGSIAAVCREMGVNRQQFDRYLSMDALPNRATTARICNYFGVEEADLYRDPAADARPFRSGRFSLLDGLAANKLFAQPAPTIAPGLYQTYMSIPGESSRVLCALTAVSVEGERATFRRITGLAEPKGSTWSHFRGDHEGIVLERFNWYFFLAMNRREPHEPTFLAVQWGPYSPEMLLCGHAMISAQSGLSVTTVVMRPLPKEVTLLKASRSCRVYTLPDPAVGSLVELALKTKYLPLPI
jgi:transcriptional regulator with XRE-family HTH domain